MQLRSETGLAWQRLFLSKAKLKEARGTSFILAAFSMVSELIRTIKYDNKYLHSQHTMQFCPFVEPRVFQTFTLLFFLETHKIGSLFLIYLYNV